jgi:hypothetical protein
MERNDFIKKPKLMSTRNSVQPVCEHPRQKTALQGLSHGGQCQGVTNQLVTLGMAWEEKKRKTSKS